MTEELGQSLSEPAVKLEPKFETEDDDIAPIAGVEENVNSRFIDYSIATPWEDLIASIERVLRSWRPYVQSPPAGAATEPPPFSVDLGYNSTILRLELMLGSALYERRADTHKKGGNNLQTKVHHYFYHQDIPLWFSVQKYVLLTRHNGTILGDSERRMILSALISALDASQVQVPAFISASPLSSIKKSTEVLGYMIVSPRQAEITLQSQDSLAITTPKVVHFESHALSNVGSKHPFFYLDGLMRLMGTKLWKFSRGNVSVSDDSSNIVISAIEFYEFRYVNASRVRVMSQNGATPSIADDAGLSLSSPPPEGTTYLRPQRAVRMNPISPVMKCTLDDLLACYPTHVNNHNSGSSLVVSGSVQDYSQALHQNALVLISSSQDNTQQAKSINRNSTSGKNMDPTLLLNSYQQQSGTAGAPSSDTTRSADFQVPLEKIMIQVHFQDLQQGSVVDNDYYTTLLPSKLPASAWGAKATFAPVSLQRSGSEGSGRTGVNYMDILSPAAVSPLFASSLRRLLALYVCGKSARSDSTFRTVLDSLDAYGNLQGCISTDRAIDISSVLSLESRRAVVFLCASASQNATPDANFSSRGGSNLQQDLLMRAFSRSLWVDDDDETATTSNADQKSAEGQNKETTEEFPTWHWIDRLPFSRSGGDSQVTSSAPVGSWLSLVSVYVSSLDTMMAMATFWQECVDEVRLHWENRVPIPRLFPPVPVMTGGSDLPGVGGGGSVSGYSTECAQEVWLEPLWEDQYTKFNQTITPFELPDMKQNLPHQKLQMVNMCIICGGVGSTVDEEQGVKCVSRARQKLEVHLEGLRRQERGGDMKEETQNEEGDSEVDERGIISGEEETSALEALSLKEILPLNVSFRDLSHVTPPRLQRRLPMTSDSLAQHRHLANKLRQGSSRSATENNLLRWQILYPELISDVKAFKACNNTVPSSTIISCSSVEESSDNERPVTFEDFLVWYGGAGVVVPTPHVQDAEKENGRGMTISERGLDGISMECLKDLWDECGEGLSGSEQKPLFKAEQEAEKALGYLEGLTIAQIARTLLSSTLPAMHMILTHDVQRCHQQLLNHGEGEKQQGNAHMKTIFDPGQELSQDLDNIGVLIRAALHDLHLDTPLMGTTASKVNSSGSSARSGGAGNKEEAVNQQALLSLDAVCSAIAELEILLMKIDSAAATLDFHPRLVGHIARYGFVTANSEAEAAIILSLAKCASFGQDSHSWHSYDGRELGIPMKKIFDVRCHAKNSLLNKSPVATQLGDGESMLDGASSEESCARGSAHDEESWATVDYFHAKGEIGNAVATEEDERRRNSSRDQTSHQMVAVLEEGALRVAFRLLEDDV